MRFFAAVLALTTAFGVAGYFLFTRPHVDSLTKADAIVVLGGERDGRVAYGLNLARQGYADTVVLSNSYGPKDVNFQNACKSGTDSLTVICFTPDPFTTRGEAMFTEKLAQEHGWQHLIVVSWNFHMVRARMIFEQCFKGTLTMRPVPRFYPDSPLYWAGIYAYQFGAIGKAVIDPC